MRLAHRAERLANQCEFPLEAGGVEIATQVLELQVDQPGIEHIGFAIIANLANAATQPAVPDFVTTHAQLTGETQQYGCLIQTRARTNLVGREHVHQVDVAPVETAKVIVPLVFPIVVAGFPVTRRLNTVLQRTIVQYRQVEAAAVP